MRAEDFKITNIFNACVIICSFVLVFVNNSDISSVMSTARMMRSVRDSIVNNSDKNDDVLPVFATVSKIPALDTSNFELEILFIF